MKNTVAFIYVLDKTKLIHNLSLSDSTPMEVHQRDADALDAFLKQYSNEGGGKRKRRNSFSVILFKSIKLLMLLKKGNYLASDELFKSSRILDSKPITYCLSDRKDDGILCEFYDYYFEKANKNGTYPLEKILKSRTHRGKIQWLARWIGYNSDFDTWISVENVHNAQ